MARYMFELVGVALASEAQVITALGGVVGCDIAYTKSVGHSFLLIVDTDLSEDDAAAAIQAVLPPGVTLKRVVMASVAKPKLKTPKP